MEQNEKRLEDLAARLDQLVAAQPDHPRADAMRHTLAALDAAKALGQKVKEQKE